MIIPLRHKSFKGNINDLFTIAKSSASDILSDKGIKATLASQAIKSVTGIEPIIDTRDPSVTWVRTTPKHSDWLESVFMQSVKKNPNQKPADFKIDIMPALNPILLKRFLPGLVLVAAIGFAGGYFWNR